jgi:glycosyltransferase involved in cell wall biosynthesis
VSEPELSVVIPLRDEEANVVPLHAELSSVLQSMRRPYEAILVEDGSSDQTFARLCEIQAQDTHVRVIRFTKNFGQTAAFAAGFAAARGGSSSPRTATCRTTSRTSRGWWSWRRRTTSSAAGGSGGRIRS